MRLLKTWQTQVYNLQKFIQKTKEKNTKEKVTKEKQKGKTQKTNVQKI